MRRHPTHDDIDEPDPTAPQSVETESRYLEDAIAEGLARLGLTKDQARIEILDEGKGGFLGIGSRKARVRVSRASTSDHHRRGGRGRERGGDEGAPREPHGRGRGGESAPREPQGRGRGGEGRSGRGRGGRPAGAREPRRRDDREPRPVREERAERPERPERAERPREAVDPDRANTVISEVTSSLVTALDENASVKQVTKAGERFECQIEAENLALVLGRHGRTLDAIQNLVAAIASRRLDSRVRVTLDSGGFRARRHEVLEQMAQDAAADSVDSGRGVHLEPMSAHDRRIIHACLASHPEVETASEDEGDRRHIVIRVKREGGGRGRQRRERDDDRRPRGRRDEDNDRDDHDDRDEAGDDRNSRVAEEPAAEPQPAVPDDRRDAAESPAGERQDQGQRDDRGGRSGRGRRSGRRRRGY